MQPVHPHNPAPMSFQWALALTFVAWFTEVILSMLLHSTLTSHGLQPMAASALVRVLAYGGVFSVLLQQRAMTYRELFHDSTVNVAATMTGLGLPILLVVPLIVLVDGLAMEWLQKLLPMSAGEATMFASVADADLGVWVLVCGIAPFVEEMFFRGILLRGLLGRYAPADAMVYSAFVFGMAHMNVYQFVIAFAVGLIAAALYRRTRSLWPGILLHAGINSLIMVFAVYGVEATSGTPLWIWAISLAGGVAGAVALRRALGRDEGQSLNV